MDTAFTALMDISAWATRASIFRSQLTWDPKPIGTFSTMISQVPPTVSPASLVASISAAIFSAASGSAQRTGDSSTDSQSILSGILALIEPMGITWLCTRMPNSSSSLIAMAPAATRPAVSRALERSSTLRTSSKPYFIAPGRSAWPGLMRVIRRVRGLWGGLVSGSTAIASPQFAQSLFSKVMPIGLPRVWPWRTPEMILARSCSISIRPPLP